MRLSARMKSILDGSPTWHQYAVCAGRIDESLRIRTSLSQPTATAYACARRALFLAAIVYVLSPVAVAQAATAPGPSGFSGRQTGSAPADGEPGVAQQAKTAHSGAALAEAKSLLEKGLVTQAEEATRQFLHQHADSAEGHYLLGYILFDEVREKYIGEEQKEG